MARKLSVLAAGVVLGVAGMASASLVAHWKLNEGIGGIARDSVGRNDGALRGGPIWVEGIKGGALQFDGTDDCVDVGNSDLFDPTGSFSVALWANIGSWSSEWAHTMIGNRSDGVGWCLRRFGGWWAQQYAGTYSSVPTTALSFTTRGVGQTGDGVEDTPSTTTPPEGEWLHIVCVYDNVNNAKYIYFNGKEDRKWNTNAGGRVTAATQSVYLGARSNAANTAGEGFFTGMLDDVRFYDHALSETEIKEVMAAAELPIASKPSPANMATDVPRDSDLAWLAGPFAATHDVYFGMSFDDVNTATRDNQKGVLVSQGTGVTYGPGLLDFGQTYYWRVDEVNAPPSSTTFRGTVWSFTAEPYAYAVKPKAATASSRQSKTMMGPERTIDGSGLNPATDQHDTNIMNMWLSSMSAPDPTWIQYEFEQVYKMHEMWVWNSNQLTEGILVNYGAREVAIDVSTDGTTWTAVPSVPEFAQGTAQADYVHNTTVNLGGLPAKYVKLTIKTSWGGGKPFSLSEVRFFQAPTRAFQPDPVDGGIDVALDATLSWRPGRDAVKHGVYLSADQAAVANGTAPVQTVTEARYALSSLAPEYGRTYYWKVNEVNDTATPVSWGGAVWSLTTIAYAVVEDFEAYDDVCKKIFFTWLGGASDSGSSECGRAPYAGNGTGSAVGNDNPPHAELSIRHSGGQSMPMTYDNTRSPFYSEATREWSNAQSWAGGGVNTLTLYVQGAAAAFEEGPAGTVVMNGMGADISGAVDEFRFVCKQLTGDGSITARVDSVANTNEWAKAGVMIRSTLDPVVMQVHMIAAPSNRVEGMYRTADGGATTTSYTGADSTPLPVWVRITRKGNSFTPEYSLNGTTWTPSNAASPSVQIEMPSTVYIGLVVTSHVTDVVCGARFSSVAISGSNVSSTWVNADVGVAQRLGNTPDTFYVVVQDSASKSKTIANPDRFAVASGVWEAWNIPLSEFTSAGVNVGSIKKMTVGIGDRSAAKAGGAGKVYIDDIRLTRAGTP